MSAAGVSCTHAFAAPQETERHALTSDNDPIRVDFVDPAAHGVSGRLGLTLAPGKRTPGVSADWDRDLGKDLARLRKHYRTDVLVTLIEKFEMEDAGIQQLRPEARRAGMRSIWFPIADLSTPRHPADPIALVRDCSVRPHTDSAQATDITRTRWSGLDPAAPGPLGQPRHAGGASQPDRVSVPGILLP